MNKRFVSIRKEVGLSQEAFGLKIGLSRSEVRNIEDGKTSLKEKTIGVLCQIYNVNPQWLREGIGDMFMPEDRYTEIARYFADLSKRPPDDFQVRLISILAKLPSEKWNVLEGIAKELAESESE